MARREHVAGVSGDCRGCHCLESCPCVHVRVPVPTHTQCKASSEGGWEALGETRFRGPSNLHGLGLESRPGKDLQSR